MAAINLKTMSVEALIDLREQIENLLSVKVTSERKMLEQKLARLNDYGGAKKGRGPGRPPGAAKRGALKGSKVEAKYRDSESGLTWAGRGLKPKWLSDAIKGGRKLEDFLINKAANAKAMVKKSTRSKK